VRREIDPVNAVLLGCRDRFRPARVARPLVEIGAGQVTDGSHQGEQQLMVCSPFILEEGRREEREAPLAFTRRDVPVCRGRERGTLDEPRAGVRLD
jgi:hypothetical protein